MNELIDACAEWIRSQAFHNTVHTFDSIVATVAIILIVMIASICLFTHEAD